MATTAQRGIWTRFGSFDRRVYILGVGWLVTAAGFAMVIPFLSIYFHRELGISMSVIGAFFGLGAVLRAAPQPFAGWLSDRLGRVPVMGWSLVLRAATFIAVGFAIMHHAGFMAIAAIVSVNYIAGAVLHPATNAMVADLVEKRQRLSAFALLRIAGNLGWAIGPGLGGFVAHHSYSLLFMLAGIVSLISGVYFLLALRDVPSVQPQDRTAFKLADMISLKKDPRLSEHCLVSFLLFLAVAQLVAALSVYSVESIGISQAQLGALYTINGLMVVLLQYPVSAFFEKYALTRQLTIGAVIYALGYGLVGFASGFTFLVMCMIIITTAEMIVSPPTLTLVANLSGPGKYGQYMGLYGFFQTAGWSLGPTLGGVLLDVFATRPMIMWLIIASLAIGASVLFRNFGRRLPNYVDSGVKEQEEVLAGA